MRSERNQSMECAKMIAALFVLLVHVPLPGVFGAWIKSLGIYTVSLFFAITGYFNYQATARQVRRRLGHVLRLNGIAFVLHVLWDCISVELAGGSTIGFVRSLMPNPGWFREMVLYSKHPFYEFTYEHLWYLLALMVCYFLYWVYVSLWGKRQVDYRPLYAVSLGLLLLRLFMEKAAGFFGMQFSVLIYGNAFFVGLPMFSLGLFLREHWEQVVSRLRLTPGKAALAVAAAVAVRTAEWRFTGHTDFFYGTFLIVLTQMLLLPLIPRVPVKSPLIQRWINSFGSLCTYMYMLHLIVRAFYEQFLDAFIWQMFPAGAPLMKPLLVLAISLVAASAAVWISNRLSRRPRG